MPYSLAFFFYLRIQTQYQTRQQTFHGQQISVPSYSIAMDIIRQRVENINRTVQNRSISEANNDSLLNDTPKEPIDISISEEKTPTVAGSGSGDGDGNAEKPKPMRRKLFAPPSMFPDIHSESFSTPIKTDTKKTGAAKTAQKRKRPDLSVENKKKSTTTNNNTNTTNTNGANKTINRTTKPISRRSTLCFETPPLPSAKPADKPVNRANARKSMMVFTSMHQPQVEFIKEVRQG